MKAKAFRVCLILLYIFLSTPALALDLGISPPDINLKINPGEQYQGEMYIFGSEKESIQVKIYPNGLVFVYFGKLSISPHGDRKTFGILMDFIFSAEF